MPKICEVCGEEHATQEEIEEEARKLAENSAPAKLKINSITRAEE
jgi:hypothetical protein